MITFIGNYQAFFRPNSPFAALIQETVWRGIPIQRKGDNGILTITDASELPLAQYLAIASAGVKIEGYPFFIQVPNDRYTRIVVPSGIPNRKITLEDGSTRSRKWNEWKDATHHHTELADGSWAIAGNSWGVELDSEAALLLTAAGYTLLSTTEYLSLLPAPTDLQL